MAINWRDIKNDASVTMLAKLKERVPELSGSNTVKMREADLPFYETYRFYEVTDAGQAQSKPRYILYRSGAPAEETFLVDGSPLPVKQVNELAPLKLSEVNVVEYVSFFFACVHKSDEQMTVIEQIYPPSETVDAISADLAVSESLVDGTFTFNAIKSIVPPRVAARLPDGGFKVDAAIMFNGWYCTIKTEIDVPASGALEVVKHEIVSPPELMGDMKCLSAIRQYLSFLFH